MVCPAFLSFPNAIALSNHHPWTVSPSPLTAPRGSRRCVFRSGLDPQHTAQHSSPRPRPGEMNGRAWPPRSHPEPQRRPGYSSICKTDTQSRPLPTPGASALRTAVLTLDSARGPGGLLVGVRSFVHPDASPLCFLQSPTPRSPESHAGGWRGPRERRHVAFVRNLLRLTPHQAPGRREVSTSANRPRRGPRSPSGGQPSAQIPPPLPPPRPSLYPHRCGRQRGPRRTRRRAQPPSRAAARPPVGPPRPRPGQPGRRRTCAGEECAWRGPGWRSLPTLHAAPSARCRGVSERRRPRSAHAFGPAVP